MRFFQFDGAAYFKFVAQQMEENRLYFYWWVKLSVVLFTFKLEIIIGWKTSKINRWLCFAPLFYLCKFHRYQILFSIVLRYTFAFSILSDKISVQHFNSESEYCHLNIENEKVSIRSVFGELNIWRAVLVLLCGMAIILSFVFYYAEWLGTPIHFIFNCTHHNESYFGLVGLPPE